MTKKVMLRAPRKTAIIAGQTYRAGIAYADPDGKLAEYQIFNKLAFRVLPEDSDASEGKPAGEANGEAVSEGAAAAATTTAPADEASDNGAATTADSKKSAGKAASNKTDDKTV